MPADPVEVAARLVRDRFPDAHAAFLGGSAPTARRTRWSDLDVVVVLDGPPAPFRETTRHDGQLVEWFVHTPDSLRHYWRQDAGRRRTPLLRMVAEGIPLIPARPGEISTRNPAHPGEAPAQAPTRPGEAPARHSGHVGEPSAHDLPQPGAAPALNPSQPGGPPSQDPAWRGERTGRNAASPGELPEPGSRGRGYQAEAVALLAAGPAAPGAAAVDYQRYLVTDLLDDLRGATDPVEIAFLAATVVLAASDLLLLAENRWSARGKWLPRRLAEVAPELPGRLAAGQRAAVAWGDRAPLESAVRTVLDHTGGPLGEGFRVAGTIPAPHTQ
ncbi:hypothetical protein [Actinoplanes sp. G11-F43]|uniref:nucleotidyltransferase domain-containing protein n=1 Tax=Actinoplanes sp. G11-F43 TaxID=3424130 RepID=UPI003D32E405